MIATPLRMLSIAALLMGPLVYAQSAEKLLQETAEHYQSLDAYEIHGVMNAQVPATGVEWRADVTLMKARKGSLPVKSPLAAESSLIANPKAVHTGSGSGEMNMTFPNVGSFDRITRAMVSVEDLGTETLKLNDEAVPCERLKVSYTSTDERPHPPVMTYWISAAKHLVVKETFTQPTGRHTGDAFFTVTFTSAKFDVPTPQWLIDRSIELAARPDVTERTEWLGKAAPDFTLPFLTGAPVKLSSLRGKVVVLDFWAIACAPCRIEMPIVEEVAKAYQNRGVAVFGVSLDEADRAKAWLEKNNHSLPTLIDADLEVTNERYKTEGIPALVVIGPDGKVRHYWEGPVSKETLQAALDKAVLR